MSKITITIYTENSAFDDDPWGEIADILQTVADDARRCNELQDFIRDSNGNKCGTIKFEQGV